MTFLKRPLLGLPIIAVLILLVPSVAVAAETVPAPQPTQALTSLQFWSLVIGGVVPLVGYVVNKYAPWVSEPAKAAFMVALAAGVNVVYQLIQVGDFALDTRHLQLVATAVIGALLAHYGYKAGDINLKLGAGQNAGLSRDVVARREP